MPLLRDRSKKQLNKLRKLMGKIDIANRTSASSKVKNVYKVDDIPEKTSDTYEKTLKQSNQFSKTGGYTKTFENFINDIYLKQVNGNHI